MQKIFNQDMSSINILPLAQWQTHHLKWFPNIMSFKASFQSTPRTTLKVSTLHNHSTNAITLISDRSILTATTSTVESAPSGRSIAWWSGPIRSYLWSDRCPKARTAFCDDPFLWHPLCGHRRSSPHWHSDSDFQSEHDQSTYRQSTCRRQINQKRISKNICTATTA